MAKTNNKVKSTAKVEKKVLPKEVEKQVASKEAEKTVVPKGLERIALPKIIKQSGAAEKKGLSETEARMKRAKEVFASHNVDELYFTSDGSCFTQMQHARMQGENLKESTVITVKRSEV